MNDLTQLPVNGSAVICGLENAGDMRRRLLDIGFVRGARVTCLFCAPSGDPRAYLVKNTVIALRAEDARSILIRKEDIL